MATIQVTEQNFSDTVKKGGIVLIDFWAAWCGPCRAFAPVFEAASKRYPDVTFGKVDTEAEPMLASAFKISAIPTLMIVRDGVMLGANPGALGAKALDELIANVQKLDMDEVRRSIAAEKTQPGGRVAAGGA